MLLSVFFLIALDKLGFDTLRQQRPTPLSGPGDPYRDSVVFDVASLILFGCSLIPTRLKILLDLLLSHLPEEEQLRIPSAFAWDKASYERGYFRMVSSFRIILFLFAFFFFTGSFILWGVCAYLSRITVSQ